MLRQSHGKPLRERKARRQGDGFERHVQLGFGWSLAALPGDPIEDFSEPGLEPPKPEVRVPMHGAMERGEVPLMMDERLTSLPMTRAPMSEMTKQEAKELFATIQAPELFRKPPSSTDSWQELRGGWVVKYHKKMRKRSFHPLHRGSGAPPTTLHAWRMTIQF